MNGFFAHPYRWWVGALRSWRTRLGFGGKVEDRTVQMNEANKDERELRALVELHRKGLANNPLEKHEPRNKGGSLEDFGSLLVEVVKTYNPSDYLKKLRL